MRLGYVSVYLPAVEAALALYERAFGLRRRLLHEGGQYGELGTGETALVEPTTKLWEQVVASVRDLDGFRVELCTEVGA